MTGRTVTHDDLVADLAGLGLAEVGAGPGLAEGGARSETGGGAGSETGGGTDGEAGRGTGGEAGSETGGGLLLVHCSMRRIGWIDGGAATLLAAIRTVSGPAVTVVVPAQTPDNSLTSPVYRAATAGMTDDERARYEAGMPGFDPDRTPSYGVGVFAEQIRTHPGALRSRHPQTSFAALGPDAAAVTAVHDLDCHLGERSPLGTLYQRRARILMLGAPMAKCTAMHLAEYRLGGPVPTMEYSCFMTSNGQRILTRFTARKLNDSDFGEAGIDIVRHSWAITGRVGNAESILLPLVSTVDRACEWFSEHR